LRTNVQTIRTPLLAFIYQTKFKLIASFGTLNPKSDVSKQLLRKIGAFSRKFFKLGVLKGLKNEQVGIFENLHN